MSHRYRAFIQEAAEGAISNETRDQVLGLIMASNQSTEAAQQILDLLAQRSSSQTVTRVAKVLDLEDESLLGQMARLSLKDTFGYSPQFSSRSHSLGITKTPQWMSDGVIQKSSPSLFDSFIGKAQILRKKAQDITALAKQTYEALGLCIIEVVMKRLLLFITLLFIMLKMLQ